MLSCGILLILRAPGKAKQQLSYARDEREFKEQTDIQQKVFMILWSETCHTDVFESHLGSCF
jgi:hypothetical protein